jgi:hypothetical protein
MDRLAMSAWATAGDQRYVGVDEIDEAIAAKADDAMVERELDDLAGADGAEGEGERDSLSGNAHEEDEDERDAVTVPRRALLERDSEEDGGGETEARSWQ